MRGVTVISIIISRHQRGIAMRICSWVLRAIVARARLITERRMRRLAHLFCPSNLEDADNVAEGNARADGGPTQGPMQRIVGQRTT